MNEVGGKHVAWGDVEIYIGDRKIESITSYQILLHDSDESNIPIDNKIHSWTFTVSLSKKNLRQLRKLCMAKKVRLPRKLKKKLKKQLRDDR